MEAKILDNLLFINYELEVGNADEFFNRLDFHVAFKEDSILSYRSNDQQALDGISWYKMNVSNNNILSSSFTSTREINWSSVADYSKQLGFSFDENIDHISIYKKGKLRLHAHCVLNPEVKLYSLYLFEMANVQVDEVTIHPPNS